MLGICFEHRCIFRLHHHLLFAGNHRRCGVVAHYAGSNKLAFDDCVFGETYYVKIDDVAADYKSKWFDKLSDEMSEYINKIEPTITIYCDKGIGTLKFRKVFTKEFALFNEYFIKD